MGSARNLMERAAEEGMLEVRLLPVEDTHSRLSEEEQGTRADLEVSDEDSHRSALLAYRTDLEEENQETQASLRYRLMAVAAAQADLAAVEAGPVAL